MIRRELPRTRGASWSRGSYPIEAGEDSPFRGIQATFGAAVPSEVNGLRVLGLLTMTRFSPDAGGLGGMGLIHAALPSGECLGFGIRGDGPDSLHHSGQNSSAAATETRSRWAGDDTTNWPPPALAADARCPTW